MKCLPNLGVLTRRASTPLLLLVMTCLLAGCQSILTTRTAATEANDFNIADLCARAWRPVTWSGRDTEQTQLEVRAINSARATFCGEAKP